MTSKDFRILSLDGGGTFCLAQARALAELFGADTPGHQVLSHFKLAAGTSGGSFVLGALANNRSPADIVRKFDDESNRKRFFSKLPVWKRWTSVLSAGRLGTRYDVKSKKAFITETLGETGGKSLAELGRNAQLPALLIVGYDYQFDRAKLLRSRPDSPAANFPRDDGRTTLAEAVDLSTHAPVNWFDGVSKPAGSRTPGYWDGALTGFNNPVQLAVSEAIGNGVPRESIGVLSIGTGHCMLLPHADPADEAYKVELKSSSLLNDLTKVARAIIAEPPDADSYLAHLSLTGAVPTAEGQTLDSPVIRCSPLIHPLHAPGQWGPPPGFASAVEFRRLVKMDISATADADVALISRLIDNWIAGRSQNQPLRRAGDYFRLEGGHWNEARCCEIGHPRFADAKAAWLRMCASSPTPLQDDEAWAS
ncbi:patatin-like phospholipase family protein [Pelomonas sp. SE-A7]|uniref:patatin-like phospholipase family protein n=1 Tax=Pelomonas sp. SE-A7 TaxID=3054953 RepID=UPI00259CE5B1|nr:patatin-like phospholipase family protein [Pelomonas sp. SE-A7]MDM4768075.1 patatin-like phospholipase family protein [Pelomonas sp. SE-A7]